MGSPPPKALLRASRLALPAEQWKHFDVSELVRLWTCSGADPVEAGRMDAHGELEHRALDHADKHNIVIEAVAHHPEPERVMKLMAQSAVGISVAGLD